MYPTLYHFVLDLTGFKIPFLQSIYTLGFFMALAWILSIFLFFRLSSLDKLFKIKLVAICLFSSIIGAQVLAYFESSDHYHAHSGLTYYGGFILASLLAIVFIRWNKKSVVQIGDTAIVPSIMGYGIGRLGCHLSGDGDWGIPNLNKSTWLPDWMWSYRFPNNVLGLHNEEPIRYLENCNYEQGYCYELIHPVYPTSLYEFLFGLITAILLLFLSKKLKAEGSLLVIGIFISALTRFGIEFIRNTPKYDLGIALSLSQIIALTLIVGCVTYYIVRLRPISRNRDR